jgi:hypothetical protein
VLCRRGHDRNGRNQRKVVRSRDPSNVRRNRAEVAGARRGESGSAFRVCAGHCPCAAGKVLGARLRLVRGGVRHARPEGGKALLDELGGMRARGREGIAKVGGPRMTAHIASQQFSSIWTLAFAGGRLRQVAKRLGLRGLDLIYLRTTTLELVWVRPRTVPHHDCGGESW